MSFIKRNYILNADISGGGSSSYPEVDTYADLILIDPATHVDEIYIVKYPSGTWITGIYQSGLYMSDGANWKLLNNWGAAFNEDNFEVYGSGDTSKQLRFRVGGLPTSTLITLDAPSSGGTIATETYVDVKAPADTRLSSGNQTTTSNVAANITELVKTLEVNKRYSISGHIHLGCSNTGGVKFGLSVPSGATFFVTGIGILSVASSTSITNCILEVSGGLSSPVFCTANSSLGYVKIDGEIQMSSNAGNVQFIFASATNTQTSTIYQLGTFLEIKEI